LRYLFEDFALDTERRELRRGDNPIALEPQVFDMLEYLIRNNERVVTKSDLFAAVWRGRIVSDSALTSRVNAARAAVADNGGDQRLIKTLHGKGLRFVGAVREAAASQARSETPEPSRPPPSLPDRPSIAVLPFANMSGEAEQEYFVDGITEDLIAEFSRFRSLFVVARNSSFVYKGRNVRVQEVARELGVHYVVEGSVRRAAKRIRVAAQLIEATNGSHVWAQRFDRDVDDVFAVQNELTESIVAILMRRLEAEDLSRIIRKPPASLVAYDYVLRAKHHHHRTTEEDNAIALKMAEAAVSLDPHYAPAHAWVACALGQAMNRGFIRPSQSLMRRAFDEAEIGRSLDDDDAECHRILCEINLLRRDYDRASYHQERALSLNPNDPRMVAQRGYLLTALGHADEGVTWIEKALRLDPAQHDDYYIRSMIVLHAAQRHADAVAIFSRTAKPQFFTHAHMAACLAELDETARAQSHVADVLQSRPDFSAATYAETLPFRNQPDRDHIRGGMLKAGLP
jgi:adenylate cyclase